MSFQNLRFPQWITLLSIVSFPVLALSFTSAASTILFIVFLCMLATLLVSRPCRQSFKAFFFEHFCLNSSMMTWFVCVLISQILHMHFFPRGYDIPLRLAFFPILLWGLYLLSVRFLKVIEWGFIVGAFVTCINMYFLTKGGTVLERGHVFFIPVISLSQMGLLLGAFALMSIGWASSSHKLVVFIKILAGCAGFATAYLSHSRGAWLAIPSLLILILWMCYSLNYFRKKIFFASFGFAFVVMMGAISLSPSIVKNRINDAERDVTEYVANSKDTSIGMRFQIWQGSWHIFLEHPLAGVGGNNYSKAMAELAERKIISVQASQLIHAHNEFLSNMAKLGIWGFIALFSVYFVPCYCFYREAASADATVKVAALMGLALCTSYVLFGLADEMFKWNVPSVFYVVLMAVFFAVIYRRKQEMDEFRFPS
jgi:O-antigen ligase